MNGRDLSDPEQLRDELVNIASTHQNAYLQFGAMLGLALLEVAFAIRAAGRVRNV